MTQYVFLSHDVDWRKQGPPLEHILARRDRFEEQVLKTAHVKNPYYNIPEIIGLEEKFGVRSTFFFRTTYENGSYLDYEDEVKSLVEGDWEIGLHSDPSSIKDIDKIKEEKTKLERLVKKEIKANRVHYLKFNSELPRMLQSLGFLYDSTVQKFKDTITPDDMHYYKIGGLIEFPLTLMDAYLFTYMKIGENQVIDIVRQALDMGRKRNNDFCVISLLWHDNVLQMKGGRMYPKILEFLASQDDVKVVKGIDLADMINRNVATN